MDGMHMEPTKVYCATKGLADIMADCCLLPSSWWPPGGSCICVKGQIEVLDNWDSYDDEEHYQWLQILQGEVEGCSRSDNESSPD